MRSGIHGGGRGEGDLEMYKMRLIQKLSLIDLLALGCRANREEVGKDEKGRSPVGLKEITDEM